MKTFENKGTEITKADEQGNITKLGYSDLATLGLRLPPQGGWDLVEMEAKLDVIRKLAQPIGSTIELENAEFDLIMATSKVKWQFMHDDVVAYGKYLKEVSEKKE